MCFCLKINLALSCASPSSWLHGPREIHSDNIGTNIPIFTLLHTPAGKDHKHVKPYKITSHPTQCTPVHHFTEVSLRLTRLNHHSMAPYIQIKTALRVCLRPLEWLSPGMQKTTVLARIEEIGQGSFCTLLVRLWLVKPLQKLVSWFFKNLKIDLQWDPNIPLLSMVPPKLKSTYYSDSAYPYLLHPNSP